MRLISPIAMKCNQKQFEAIKPKLKGIGYCFDDSVNKNLPYIMTSYTGVSKLIGSGNNVEKQNQNRDIHETWNERIFLEACGIEVEETFEITKEQILIIHDKTSTSNQDELEKWFPEVFDVKLEVGKWYKNDQSAIFFTCNINNEKPYGYGITAGKVFVEDDNFAAWSVSGIELATEQEVFEALKNEAVKRGFVGKDIYIKIGGKQYCLESEIGKFQLASNLFFYQGAKIFDSGIWATIIPTKTKEEAEKLLNCKIV